MKQEQAVRIAMAVHAMILDRHDAQKTDACIGELVDALLDAFPEDQEVNFVCGGCGERNPPADHHCSPKEMP